MRKLKNKDKRNLSDTLIETGAVNNVLIENLLKQQNLQTVFDSNSGETMIVKKGFDKTGMNDAIEIKDFFKFLGEKFVENLGNTSNNVN